MIRLFKIVVDVPALDRLLDFLESKAQGQIDSQVQRIVATTARMKAANDHLQAINTSANTQPRPKD